MCYNVIIRSALGCFRVFFFGFFLFPCVRQLTPNSRAFLLNFLPASIRSPCLLHLFLYKKTVYKNIQAEIPEKIRASLRTSQPQIMARIRYLGNNLLFLLQNSITFTYQY